jgi:hypothetical protein
MANTKDTTTYFMKFSDIEYVATSSKDYDKLEKESGNVTGNANMQMYLVFNDGQGKQVALDSIVNNQVHFRLPFDTLLYFLPIDKVSSIIFSEAVYNRYASRVLKEIVDCNTTFSNLSEEEYERLGNEHAYKYYKGYRTIAALTAVASTVTFGVYALPLTVITSLFPPSESAFKYPQSCLTNNETYNKAYASRARKIRAKQIWNHYLYGLAASWGTVIIISAFLYAIVR